MPAVQSPLPFQACNPLPVVMNPIWISPFSSSRMFSFGPSVGRVVNDATAELAGGSMTPRAVAKAVQDAYRQGN